MKYKYINTASFIIVFIGIAYLLITHFDINQKYKVGEVIDSLNHVKVYYNGGMGNVEGSNVTSDGYNLGLKYQSIEYAKRYYYKHLNCKIKGNYNHAKDFFNKSLDDDEFNTQIGLQQYTNSSKLKPAIDDLVVFDGNAYNRYGQLAIISNVTDTEIEIIRQNPGQFANSREKFPLLIKKGKWKIKAPKLLGWLRIRTLRKN